MFLRLTPPVLHSSIKDHLSVQATDCKETKPISHNMKPIKRRKRSKENTPKRSQQKVAEESMNAMTFSLKISTFET